MRPENLVSGAITGAICCVSFALNANTLATLGDSPMATVGLVAAIFSGCFALACVGLFARWLVKDDEP